MIVPINSLYVLCLNIITELRSRLKSYFTSCKCNMGDTDRYFISFYFWWSITLIVRYLPRRLLKGFTPKVWRLIFQVLARLQPEVQLALKDLCPAVEANSDYFKWKRAISGSCYRGSRESEPRDWGQLIDHKTGQPVQIILIMFIL